MLLLLYTDHWFYADTINCTCFFLGGPLPVAPFGAGVSAVRLASPLGLKDTWWTHSSLEVDLLLCLH